MGNEKVFSNLLTSTLGYTIDLRCVMDQISWERKESHNHRLPTVVVTGVYPTEFR